MAFNLNDYQTCAERLELFWKDNPNGRVHTTMLEGSASRFIVLAAIYRGADDTSPWATGLAEETVAGRGVNATSALENCETSSIARALANAGYSPKGDSSKRASREEMEKVASRTAANNAIAEAKSKMASTSKEYVPIAKEDDPWTIREAKPASTVDEAVAMVKDIIGGQTERDIPNCTCGVPMAWKTGQGKNNKPWGHFKCSIWNKSTGSGCETVTWYEVGANGAWRPQERKW